MSKFHQEDKKALTYALMAVFFWSTVASAFKITLNYINSIHLLAFSSIFSAIVLFLILLINKKWQILFSQSKKKWFYSAISGLLNPFLYYIVLFSAYSILKAQEAMVLNYSWPLVLTTFSAFFLKRKLKKSAYFALLISFFGIVIIATRGNILTLQFTDSFGVLLALGSSVIWSLYWILNMKDERDSVVKLASGFLFGSIYSIILLLFQTEIVINIQGLIGSLYIGTFEMGLTFVLWLTAISKTKQTALVSQFVYLSPFLSLFFINFVLGEKVLFSSFFGLIFIISGIIIQSIQNKKSSEEDFS
jgi:drug/metabolite transporter (DMT)-like permease